MSKIGRAAIGWSVNPNAFAAGQAAAHIALQRLLSHRPTCAIVFASAWFEQAPLLAGVRSVFNSTPVVGGSTAGEITPEGPKSHSCIVLAVAYDDLAVGVGTGTEVEKSPRLAGYRAAQEVMRQFTGKTRSGLLLFGDGLLTGYTDVLRGVQEIFGTSSLVTGGLMGDDLRFTATYQYAQDQVLSRAVVGLLLGGSCTIGVGIEHGFAPISKPRRVTKAKANILYELDGQPASSVYEEYFGPSVRETAQQGGLNRGLIAYPLGIQMDSTGQFLLRNVMAFGNQGSLACSGEVTEESWVQLMIGSKDLVLEAATLAAKEAIQPLQSVWFALVFDSVARKQLLGRDATMEIACIRQVIGPSVPLVGCYTYGEQAPLGKPYPYGQSSVQTGACLVIAVGPSG
jgi:hypothetical protein